MSTASIEQALIKGTQSLGLTAPIDDLCHYLTLLHKWNKAYNLTAIRDLNSMVTLHALDSLAILPWINGQRILDVGTGAGLPGVPLALANRTLHVVLLDSNGKKTRFLQEVKRSLKLDNIDIVQTRVEQYHPEQGFDTITSRAFSDMQQLLNSTQHLMTQHGIWLAMKGRKPLAELTHIDRRYRIDSYTVPGIDGERCCVIVENEETSWQK